MTGKISISRFSGGEIDTIRISLIDDSSGVCFVEVTMGCSDFAKAITGLGHSPCAFDLRGIDLVGKTRETKTAQIKMPKAAYNMTDKELEDMVEPYLVDGWTVDFHNLRNMHRIQYKDGVPVVTAHFRRWV